MFVFGVFHFMNTSAMVGMLSAWPAPTFWVYLSGAGLIATGLALALNKYTVLAAKLLALELGLFILFIHLPGAINGNQMSIMSLLKDLAIMGGALLVASCGGCKSDGCKMCV
jgi:uncharacterized membrane protein YphA (DoxX/SURF4 family)